MSTVKQTKDINLISRLSNWEKARLLQLLESSRFEICQHGLKMAQKEIDLSNWVKAEVKTINSLIEKLDLRTRDPNELKNHLIEFNKKGISK